MPTLADADCLRPRAKTQKDEKRGTLLNVIVGPERVEGLKIWGARISDITLLEKNRGLSNYL